jgi:hypothetical protein
LLVINLYFSIKLTLCIMFEFELAFFSNFELFEFLKVRGVRGFEVLENIPNNVPYVPIVNSMVLTRNIM